MSQMNPGPYLPAAPTVGGEPPPGTYWLPPPPPPPPPPHRGEQHLGRWILISVLVAAIAAGGSGIGVGWGLAKALRQQPAVQSPAPIAIASPTTAPINGSAGANAIAAKVDPAIVDINTIVGSGKAAGTGMIVTSGGEVLTNNHVVDGSTSIQVTIAAHSGTFTAHVIGVAPAADVALIQIEGVSNLPTVTITSSSTVQVGDSVVALGNALGVGGTPSVSTGNVTALNQSITASEGGGKSEQLTGMIQSDAAISPGDSGGPIVNSAGQVVGMITAGDVQGFRSQTSTVNYAIPSDTLTSYISKINSGVASSDLTYGQVGFMGVSVRDLTTDVASQLGFNVSSGVFVVGVTPGSAAESGGIPAGSVITSVGGTKVTSSATLGTAIQAHKPGERVAVTWVDVHGSHTSTVTLAGVNP
ncbi:MAG: S1C family serine protease [Candidatus Dormibacteraeota bacterium]|nr:S1C family serine protease [Candidatus Dormibacteraeota bacterium]